MKRRQKSILLVDMNVKLKGDRWLLYRRLQIPWDCCDVMVIGHYGLVDFILTTKESFGK